MARSKKKRKQAQKQIERRMRRAKERKRRSPSAKVWQGSSMRPDDEVVDDMLPFFRASGSLGDMHGSGLKELVSILLTSADMAKEPEFEEIIISPILCAGTFADVSQEMGIDPENLPELSGDEREEIQIQMREESIRRLLTEEVCQDILKGLDALRLRLKRAGKLEEAAKAAVLQSSLSQGDRDIWPVIGLVQGIFHRNFTAGFELLEMAMQVDAPEGIQGRSALLERLNRPELRQKSEGILKKIPGLRGYLQKQAEKIWKEGAEALYSGELYLGLFAEKELKGVAGILAEFTGYDSAMGKTEKPAVSLDSEDMRKALFARLDEYITGLLTPERIDQLRGELDSILQEMGRDEKWLSFTLMLKDNVAHEDAAVSEKWILLRTLLGELRTADDASDEERE